MNLLDACMPWQMWQVLLEMHEAPMVLIDGGFAFVTLIEGHILIVRDFMGAGFCSVPGLTA